MPKQHLNNLRDALEKAEGADFMVPADQAKVTQIALIHALRSQSDVLERIVAHQDKFDSAISDIRNSLHKIDTRLALIENSSLERDVTRNASRIDTLEAKVSALETDKAKRDGAAGLVSYISSNWALLVALAAAVAVAAFKIIT